MKRLISGFTFVAALAIFGSQLTAQDYTLDAAHTSISFQASHLGISWTHGRFNKFEGAFKLGQEDQSQSNFTLQIATESIDTGNQQRDDHLRSPDFFNAKQFPMIAFQSNSVESGEGGLEVKGNLTLHGVTQPVTFLLKGGQTAEFPAGTKRIGFTTTFSVKRSDFGMDGMMQAIGDEVFVSISFEGIQK